jgi:hypothetical protein
MGAENPAAKRGRPPLPPEAQRIKRGLSMPSAAWAQLADLQAWRDISADRLVERLIAEAHAADAALRSNADPLGRAFDETGNRYGKLAVMGRAKREGRGVFWTCLCDCGATLEVRADDLRKRTRACKKCAGGGLVAWYAGTPCRDCTLPQVAKNKRPAPGEVRHQAHGLCNRCYGLRKRAGKPFHP